MHIAQLNWFNPQINMLDSCFKSWWVFDAVRAAITSSKRRFSRFFNCAYIEKLLKNSWSFTYPPPSIGIIMSCNMNGKTSKLFNSYTYNIQGGQIMRLCRFWAYFRIFMRLFLLCGYAVIRIISFLDLPLFAKIPLILPYLSHFSLTICNFVIL